MGFFLKESPKKKQIVYMIAGVRVYPKWDWSPTYLKDVREQTRFKTNTYESMMDRALKYMQWRKEAGLSPLDIKVDYRGKWIIYTVPTATDVLEN